MKLEPNESKLIIKENSNDGIRVWNRTRKPIMVYYTSRGVEIHES